jgi:hypothetical protein
VQTGNGVSVGVDVGSVPVGVTVAVAVAVDVGTVPVGVAVAVGVVVAQITTGAVIAAAIVVAGKGVLLATAVVKTGVLLAAAVVGTSVLLATTTVVETGGGLITTAVVGWDTGELVTEDWGATVTVGKLGLMVMVGIGTGGVGFWAGSVGKIVITGNVLVGTAIGTPATTVGVDNFGLTGRVETKSNTPI